MLQCTGSQRVRHGLVAKQQQRKKQLPWWLSGKKSTLNAGDIVDSGSVPGLERSPGEENGNPLQYFCLGNLMDRGAGSPWSRKESYHDSVTKQQQKQEKINQDISKQSIYTHTSI